MSDKDRPLLLVGKDIKETVVLDLITVEMDVRKERDIQLLEWAVAMPLLKLPTPPSLAEIAKNLGIGIEFLTSVAEQLRMRKALEKVGDDTYKLTDNGRRMVEKNRIIGDPREMTVYLVYHPQSKEWLPGATINPDVLWEVESEDSIPDMVPERALVQHAKLLGLMTKDDILYEQAVESAKSYQLNTSFNLVLKKDGLLAIPQDRSIFGADEVSIDRVLKGLIPELGRSVYRRVEGDDDWSNAEEITPNRLPSDFTPYAYNELKAPLAKMLLKKNTWIVTSDKEALRELTQARNPPELILYLGHQSIDDVTGNALILWEPELQIDGIAALDGWVLRRVVVNDHNIKVPILSLLPWDVSFSTVVADHLKKKLSRGSKDLERSKALFLLEPGWENLDRISSAIMALKDENARRDTTISYFLKVRAEWPDLVPGPLAIGALTKLYNGLPIDQLINTDHSLATMALTEFGETLLKKLREMGSAAEKFRKPLLSEKDRCKDTGLQKVFEKALALLDEILLLNLKNGANVASLEEGHRFLEILSKLDQSKIAEPLELLYQSVRKLSLEQEDLIKLLELYIKIGNKGVKVSDADLKVVLLGYLGTQPLPIDDISTKMKLEKLMKIKGGIPEAVLNDVLKLPNVEKTPTNLATIRIVLYNIKCLRQLTKSADEEYALAQIESMAVRLEQVNNAESWSLWLICLAASWKEYKSLTPSYDREDLIRIARENKLDNKANQTELRELGILEVLRHPVEKVQPKEEKADIYIDGSNIARGSNVDGIPRAKDLITAYEHLVNTKLYRRPVIIIGSAVHHTMQDFDQLVEYFKNEGEIRGYSILYQAPATESDDLFILKFAKRHGADILTNDLYRDHFDKNPELRVMKSKLRRCMITDGSFELSPSYDDGSEKK